MSTAVFFDNFQNKNHISLGKLLTQLFSQRGSLLVIRIDLGYRREVSHLITLEMAQEHRSRLLDNRRQNSLFQYLAGYGWALDRGEFPCNLGGAGFFHHFAFFFDGRFCDEDEVIARGIARYFETTITNGQGHACFDSLIEFAELGFLGTKLIDSNDSVLRNQLLESIAVDITRPAAMEGIRSATTASGEFRVFSRSRLWKQLVKKV